ncbi:hypothetical protein DOTSEDRAFT_166301 [Dothistroma septosporum NZE10]|uniref:Potassium channel domain-containing protein n=1 Tax=Dothistroma septosporum (strain NZE10 / CBS 128990) TaxID=675120 RepID=N1PV28_DOTSN|nr:hypothetical protein DOTSEDRAFT_166301 [Dothistroma septosporum NZE10]
MRRRSSGRRDSEKRKSSIALQRTGTGRRWWKFHLRDWDDDDEQDWWFASIAIPLIAAAVGPLANVFSVAALVTSWRIECQFSGNATALGTQLDGQDFADPRWCYNLNVVSLIVGFIGNFFLLCNFTNRIRYIIALPVTIICWYIATGILLGITVAMEIYEAPVRPQQTYTQGFWYAVIAACMYMICAMLLMVNMLGYWLGHYPQHFALTESQRTLILQTMLFFIWLAGGAAVFARVESIHGDHSLGIDWSYVNSLYYCDVTILTVGFGDLYPSSNIGRGLVFPYAVGGIIMLGLMVSSIAKFAGELGSENLLLLREEKDRFDAMRKIQHSTSRFKNWYALFLSVTAFGVLWCVGAVVFWQCEKGVQGMTYFQALYFCYVCLLTIGYGDLAPKSNAGRPFFVLWSLVAVPTMTILVSDLGETVINKFKAGTSGLADFTVLPQKGAYRSFLNRHPWLLGWLQQRKDRKQARKRLEEGFPTGPEPATDEPPTINELAKEACSDQELAKKLARVIRKTANDVKDHTRKRYTYEEWVEITQLIRFTASSEEKKAEEEEDEDEDEGLVEWDWIGEDSPMMANKSEAEFVLDRLCESMSRYIKRVSSFLPDSPGDSRDGSGRSAHPSDEIDETGPYGEKAG